MSEAQRIEIIDGRLGGHGKVIVEEAQRAGLGLPLACALVEQESGGRNIFGCDWGTRWTDVPPYCNVDVTERRVNALLRNVENGGGSNGVGLTQLTYPPLIKDANRLGGAHLPRFQCRVGFRVLKDYIESMGQRQGIGAYNGGPSNPIMSYADSVLERREQWRDRLP